MKRFKGTKEKWIYRVVETDTAMFPLIIKRTPKHDDGDENHLIVAVFNVNDRESKEHIANAKLISKAPEMLEMLIVAKKELLFMHEQFTESLYNEQIPLVNDIEKLIKEATEI